MLIRWSATAHTDIIEILSYFASIQEMKTGQRIVDYLRKASKPLKSFPMVGRLGRIEGTRELVLSGMPYLLVYRVGKDSVVEIVRVLHTSRLLLSR